MHAIHADSIHSLTMPDAISYDKLRPVACRQIALAQIPFLGSDHSDPGRPKTIATSDAVAARVGVRCEALQGGPFSKDQQC